MERLDGVIRRYAWGSRYTIASVQGRPVPTAEPEAELWLGAHPVAPSTLWRGEHPIPLDQAISTAPEAFLGERLVAEYGPRLPFLLKLLAPAAPLSLQAHPDANQARAGYARGGFADPYHKPELLVAVEPFVGLCGFADSGASADRVAALGVPELTSVESSLRHGDLAGAVRELLTWPARKAADLVAAATRSAMHLPGPEYATLAELGGRYPDDVGVVLTLLLNRVTLAPGEAIFMPPGNLHAYLHGTGIEIMAASDNVVRGGLTEKPVDVPELLRVLRFETLREPLVRPEAVGAGVVTWPVPVAEFALYRARPAGNSVTVPGCGPRIALCLTGRVQVDDGDAALGLVAGQAAAGPASPKPLAIAGDGEVYVATTRQS